MKQHTITTYTISEHPEPDAVYEWVRNNWHDLGEHVLSDSLESLKGFSDFYNLNLDYSFGIFPDRGEFIKATIDNDDISELSGARLYKYLENNYSTYFNQFSKETNNTLAGECPFTGVCYDEILLDPIREFMKKPDTRTFQELLNDCGDKLLESLHAEGEYIYSDEGLKEHLSANEYDFNVDGSIF